MRCLGMSYFKCRPLFCIVGTLWNLTFKLYRFQKHLLQNCFNVSIFMAYNYDLFVKHFTHLIVTVYFYRAMLCIRGTSHGPVSVCPCPCLSQVGVLLKRQNVGSHKWTGTLVFWCQRSPRNSTGVTPHGGAKCRWGGENRRLSTNNRLYLENGTR